MVLLYPEDFQRKCCGNFHAKDIYSLEPEDYSERILETGFCPQCGCFVVTLCKRDFKGNWTYLTAKRKKAVKLFNDNKASIIGGIQSVKFGNKSNMGFRYGVNKSVKTKNKKTELRQYAVDFNGTKERVG